MRGDRDIPEKGWSGDWGVLRKLAPYMLEFPLRVGFALAFLVAAKLANVAVPFLLKYIVDHLNTPTEQLLAVPFALLFAYGFVRFSTSLFGELRDAVFSRVAERGMRRIGLEVFQHVHALDIDFHLSRKTGGLSRDIDRGTNGISFLLRFMLFNIVPTILELLLVSVILFVKFDGWYVLIIVVSITAYITYSVVLTNWRLKYIRKMNEMDNRSNTRAIDSLLNFETVKYFGNEEYEATQYDERLGNWENARLQSRYSLFVLNTGQALLIAIAMTVMMLLASHDVVKGGLTIGDLVLVNAFIIQLFIPLNFLGFVYREIKTSMANIERMFELLTTKANISDAPNAPDLVPRGGEVRFEHVDFHYKSDRAILKDINFTIHAGKKLAVVGPTGSGKSTIARLLFRFYDPISGRILVDGENISKVTQHSLRMAIGVVPQDTVLFNDTILYNIQYGNIDADQAAIDHAADLANLSEFITQLPLGYETIVGERGLKLSGGEKQRIAIARTLLKNPDILIFDEATASLDSTTEQAILSAMNKIAANRTTLTIAHRLSTVVDADEIIVLQAGEIVEQGTHSAQLSKNGLYAQLWQHQKQHPEDFKNTADEPKL